MILRWQASCFGDTEIKLFVFVGSLYTDLTSNSAGGKQIKVGNVVVQVQAGDVTTENVDAIVNSTNYDLDLKKGMSNNNKQLL